MNEIYKYIKEILTGKKLYCHICLLFLYVLFFFVCFLHKLSALGSDERHYTKYDYNYCYFFNLLRHYLYMSFQLSFVSLYFQVNIRI